jgi:hypothetical protein
MQQSSRNFNLTAALMRQIVLATFVGLIAYRHDDRYTATYTEQYPYGTM